MNFLRRTPLLLLALLLAACVQENKAEQLDAQAHYNEWIVAGHHDESVRAAVIKQSTIYPYHFVANGAQLNDLGERDAGYLAAHFVRYPGRLNVRRGDASHDLYAARVQSVRDVLVQAGVVLDQVPLSDGQTGGDGLAADRVMLVLERDIEPLQSTTTQSNIPQIGGQGD